MNRLNNEENVKLKSDTQTYITVEIFGKNNIDGSVAYCFVQLTTCVVQCSREQKISPFIVVR